MMIDLQLFARKKGVGSSRNGRDSHSKRLGVKIMMANLLQWAALSYARGERRYTGRNVGMGKDYTIFAKADGYVSFERRGRNGRIVSVIPVAEASVSAHD